MSKPQNQKHITEKKPMGKQQSKLKDELDKNTNKPKEETPSAKSFTPNFDDASAPAPLFPVEQQFKDVMQRQHMSQYPGGVPEMVYPYSQHISQYPGGVPEMVYPYPPQMPYKQRGPYDMMESPQQAGSIPTSNGGMQRGHGSKQQDDQQYDMQQGHNLNQQNFYQQLWGLAQQGQTLPLPDDLTPNFGAPMHEYPRGVHQMMYSRAYPPQMQYIPGGAYPMMQQIPQQAGSVPAGYEHMQQGPGAYPSQMQYRQAGPYPMMQDKQQGYVYDMQQGLHPNQQHYRQQLGGFHQQGQGLPRPDEREKGQNDANNGGGEVASSIYARGHYGKEVDALYQEPNADNIQDFIKVLDEHRKTCEVEGKYVEAKMAKNRIAELKKQYFQRKQEQKQPQLAAPTVAQSPNIQKLQNVLPKSMGEETNTETPPDHTNAGENPMTYQMRSNVLPENMGMEAKFQGAPNRRLEDVSAFLAPHAGFHDGATNLWDHALAGGPIICLIVAAFGCGRRRRTKPTLPQELQSAS